jgi:Flp pilus assembly pilin Flp
VRGFKWGGEIHARDKKSPTALECRGKPLIWNEATRRVGVAHGLQNTGSMNSLRSFLFDETGQTATEYMLIISVVVIAVVAAAFTFVPTFQQGVADLAADVSTILDGGCINGCAGGGGR